ncbi:hypothetical protein BKA18_005625 [Streptomyces auratus]
MHCRGSPVPPRWGGPWTEPCRSARPGQVSPNDTAGQVPRWVLRLDELADGVGFPHLVGEVVPGEVSRVASRRTARQLTSRTDAPSTLTGHTTHSSRPLKAGGERLQERHRHRTHQRISRHPPRPTHGPGCEDLPLRARQGELTHAADHFELDIPVARQ